MSTSQPTGMDRRRAKQLLHRWLRSYPVLGNDVPEVGPVRSPADVREMHEAFATLISSPRTWDDRMGLFYVEFLMITRSLDRDAATTEAKPELQRWQAAAHAQRRRRDDLLDPWTYATIGCALALLGVCAVYGGVVGYVVHVVVRGPEPEAPGWYLVAVALAATVVDIVAIKSRLERMSQTRWWALVLLAPVAVALILVLAGA